MRKKESRRRVPVSVVAMAAIALLFVLEGLVIGGAFGVKAATVARIAPWAYEPFLRLVGEHPESAALKESIGDQKEDEARSPSGMASVAGFNADELVIDLDTLIEADGDVGAEVILPMGTQSNSVPTGSSRTNPIPDRSGDVVPVG